MNLESWKHKCPTTHQKLQDYCDGSIHLTYSLNLLRWYIYKIKDAPKCGTKLNMGENKVEKLIFIYKQFDMALNFLNVEIVTLQT